MILSLATTLESISSIIVGVGAIIALGGTGVYMVRRRQNGQPALPGGAHDESVHVLREIRDAITKGNDTNSQEHENMLDVLAPRKPGEQ